MATDLRVRTDLGVNWTYRNIDADSSRTVVDSNSLSFVKTFSDGNGLDQSNLIWDDRRTVNAAANDDLDLAGGVTNSFGTTVTFAKIRGLFIHNLNTTAGHLLHVGGQGTEAINTILGGDTEIIKIGPDGVLVLINPSAAGYAVTAATADILRLTGVSGNIVYDIAIWGNS